MRNGTKIKGSNEGPNFILIESKFHLVSPDLVSFSILKTDDSIVNIEYIGYSKPLSMVFIQMRNGGRYFYRDVPKSKWQDRHNYDKLNIYWATELRGHYSYFQSDEDFVKEVPNEYVLDSYLKLEEYKSTKSGLYATDRPDLVIDPEKVLFQI